MHQPSGEDTDTLQVGDLVLHRSAYLVSVQDQPVVLTLQEFRLLEMLMANADHVLPSKHLLDSLWGQDFTGDPGTLAVHVLRLRKKLGHGLRVSQHIRTVRGVGYIFDTNPVAAGPATT